VRFSGCFNDRPAYARLHFIHNGSLAVRLSAIPDGVLRAGGAIELGIQRLLRRSGDRMNFLSCMADSKVAIMPSRRQTKGGDYPNPTTTMVGAIGFEPMTSTV
jgi:hypothetical protein